LASGVAEPDLRRGTGFYGRLPAQYLAGTRQWHPSYHLPLIFRVDRTVFGLNIGSAEKIPLT
jgi:hypothetical protein